MLSYFAAEAVLLRIRDQWTQNKICDLVMLFQGIHSANVPDSSTQLEYFLTYTVLYPVAEKYKRCKHSMKQTNFLLEQRGCHQWARESCSLLFFSLPLWCFEMIWAAVLMYGAKFSVVFIC